MMRVKLNTTGTVIRLTAVLGSIQPVYQEYITIQIERCRHDIYTLHLYSFNIFSGYGDITFDNLLLGSSIIIQDIYYLTIHSHRC